MTAFSRGFYFILVGMVAFLIDVALENGPQDPLTVYRFNLSSPQILIFVRDGLLSKQSHQYQCLQVDLIALHSLIFETSEKCSSLRCLKISVESHACLNFLPTLHLSMIFVDLHLLKYKL